MKDAKHNGVTKDSSLFYNPKDFFNSFNAKKQKLIKKELKKGQVITFKGNSTGIKTLIGWNKEVKGYFFFRTPNQEPKFEGFADVIYRKGGYAFYNGVLINKTHFNGDGINEWCLPPESLLEQYGITINEGGTE